MSQAHYARNESLSAGAVLAAAREDLNLSVSDVARHLKLSPAQVEALEDGAYERLPGRVFVRGFLRNYAKLLGIDPQPLLRSIEYEMPQPPVVEEPPPTPEVVMPHGERSRWPLYTALAAVLVAGALAVYEFGFNEVARNGGSVENQAAATPGSPASTPAAPARPAPAAPSANVQSKAVPASPTTAAAPEPAFGAPPSAESSKAAQPGERELHFRFDIESWVEVRDRNDKVIFSKLNRAGAEERVAGMPPLKLVVGNARGVRLTYDDRPVDLTPHIGVTVARMTVQ